jgi:protein-S-isoprenylcysteine O-methyltransferase Ste14
VFYALLLAAPVEWLLRGRPAGAWQLVAAGIFLAGLVGYRRAGSALGPHLGPLIAPREPAALVAEGPYRRRRHPMYGAEIAMAFGAALTLGAWLSAGLAAVFTALVLGRIQVEERVLADRIPGYRSYQEKTYRLIPYVY